MAPNKIRGSRATTKISRSGLTPATTLRHVTPVEPTHGATSNTARQNRAHGPTTARNRAAVRPPSRRGDNVAAAAIGPLEDSGVDFKDVIKVLGRENLIGRSVGHEVSGTDSHHAPGVPRGQIHIMRHADDRHAAFAIQMLEDIVELHLDL